jgi:hypothetical protein
MPIPGLPDPMGLFMEELEKNERLRRRITHLERALDEIVKFEHARAADYRRLLVRVGVIDPASG